MVRPKHVAVLSLIALAPVIAYYGVRGEWFIAAAALNVLLITAAIYLMMGDVDVEAPVAH
jgi:hypothetical protein